MSILYIIAGPNGAGKTTASMEYLKDEIDCYEFVNADNIALGLSPFRPENVAVSAGRIMLARIDELISQGIDFAIETTLSSKTLLDKIRMAKSNNYEINLLFYWLESPELAVKRVESRVESGGHGIQEDIIIRRYYRGIKNFFEIYLKECDYWLMINNSDLKPFIIAEGTEEDISIKDKIIWNNIMVEYGQEI
jgi:predicted ABC-type ATPase